MERGDLRLEPVRARRSSGGPSAGEALEPGRDPDAVPAAPILLLEGEELARRVYPCVAAGVLEQQERPETQDLVVPREQHRDEVGEMEGLFGEVVAEGSVVRGCVALVEDEVDHGQHARRTLVEPVRRGHAEADPGVRDLGPRP